MLTLTRIDATGKDTLRSGFLTDVRVAADARANSLVVTAPAESMDLIAALVEQLDELPTSEAQIKVFTIVNGDAASLADMLNELFGQTFQQQDDALRRPASAPAKAVWSHCDSRSTTAPTASSPPVRRPIWMWSKPSCCGWTKVTSGNEKVASTGCSMHRPKMWPTPSTNCSSPQRQVELLAPDAVSPFELIEREVIVVPELVSNSLLISATPQYFEEIANWSRNWTSGRPMVLIQVLIAEVDLGTTDELGVELGIQDSLLFDRSTVIGGLLEPGFNFNNRPLGNANSPESLALARKTAGQGLTSFAVGRTNQQLGYGGLVLSANSESINILIRALQESRRLDILSRPQVMTLNNQPAFVLVGQRVPDRPIHFADAGGGHQLVNLENVGLLLGVTPRISPDGLVVMEIDAEKSSCPSKRIPISITATGDVITSPIINTTQAQTTVSARSGQTVILGGLITKSRAK